MKPYFLFSTIAHGLFLAALIMMGTLLSKPRMSYYAVDILSSLPAGGGTTAEPAVPPASSPVSPVPKVASPQKRVSSPQPVVEEEASDQDTIRLLAKLKQKRMALKQSEPQAVRAPAATQPSNAGRGGVGLPGAGAGIVADAGQAFPYPWYLKAVGDRLDKQWHPPEEFEPDTICQVSFVVNKAGQVSGIKISKSSGNVLFDQLALRAVVYANSLPPLPTGYPEETLNVHMKFVGRRL